MDLETLKVKILATSRLSEELTTTAFAADRVAESMQDGAVAGSELAAGMSWSESEASSLTRQLGAANSELAEGAAEGAVYAEGLSEVAQEQAEASATAAMFEQRIDEVGDEALTSAAQMQAFGSATDSAADSQLRANLAGISGSLARIGTVAAAATPPLLAMGAGLTGIAGFGGAGAAGAFGFTAAGIQSRAEEMAAFSEELESASDAREQLMEGFMGELESATDVLQTPAAEQFALANMQAVVDVVGEASDALASVQPTIFAVAGGLREAFVATSPELFGELADQTEALAPLFMELRGTIQRLPALIGFLGDATQRIGGDIFRLGSALLEVVAGATQVGIAVSDVLLPPLSAALFVAGGVLSIFEALPGPLQNGAAAFLIAGTGAYFLSGAMGTLAGSTFVATAATKGLTAALFTLTLPISGTAVAIAALIGGAAALASHLGLLDDATGALVAGWNELVDIAELAVNGVLWLSEGLYDLLGPLALLIPGLGPAIVFLGNLDAIVRDVGDGIEWLKKQIRDLAAWADKYLGPVIDAYERLKERAGEEGGVDFSGAEIGGGDDDDGSEGGGSGGDGSSDPPAPPAAGAAATGSSDGTTVDMSNSEFYGSTTESDVKQWVKDGVREANRASRRREDAQGG